MKYETHTATLNGIGIDSYGEFLKDLVSKEKSIIHTQFLWHNNSTTKGGAVIVYQTKKDDTDEATTKGLEQLFGTEKQTSIQQITYSPTHNTDDDKTCEEETSNNKIKYSHQHPQREETMLVLEKPENGLVG